MKVTSNIAEIKFTISDLTAAQFGYIVASLGVQRGDYGLYRELSDVAELHGIKHKSSQFGDEVRETR